MRARLFALMVVMLAVAPVCFAQGAPKAPRGQIATLIVGTSRMTGAETRVVNGSGPTTRPRGTAPAGYIIYDTQIDENDQSVIHHMEGSVNPRNIGNGMKRFVEVSHDKLSLNTFAKGPDGRERVALRMWERVK